MTSVPTRATWPCICERAGTCALCLAEGAVLERVGRQGRDMLLTALVSRADVLALVEEEIALYQELGISQPSLKRLRERLSE